MVLSREQVKDTALFSITFSLQKFKREELQKHTECALAKIAGFISFIVWERLNPLTGFLFTEIRFLDSFCLCFI